MELQTKFLLILYSLYGWKITILDIKNAYLMVLQTETVLMKMWMDEEDCQIGEGISSLLRGGCQDKKLQENGMNTFATFWKILDLCLVSICSL